MLYEKSPSQKATIYLSLNNEIGKFQTKINGEKKFFEAVEGKLTSIGKSDYEFKGTTIKKIILNVEVENEHYQISFGYGAFFTMTLMNLMLSIPAQNFGGNVLITISSDERNSEKFWKPFIQYNGDWLKQKHKSDDLRKLGVYGAETAEAKKKALSDYIEKAFNALESKNISGTIAPVLADAETETDDDDDAVPF